MANTEQTKKRSEARAKRAANRKAAEAQALKDASVKKADVAAAEAEKAKTAQKQKAPTKTRRETKLEAMKAAERQAEADARAKVSDAPVQLVRGSTPSLHELNKMAKAANRGIRDTARDAANAAGKAAFEVLKGKNPGTSADAVVRRHRTVARAQTSLAKTAAAAARAEERG